MVKKNFAFGMQLSVFLSKNGMGVSKVQNFIFVDSGQATFSFRLEKVCPSSKKICPFIIIKVKKKKKTSTSRKRPTICEKQRPANPQLPGSNFLKNLIKHMDT